MFVNILMNKKIRINEAERWPLRLPRCSIVQVQLTTSRILNPVDKTNLNGLHQRHALSLADAEDPPFMPDLPLAFLRSAIGQDPIQIRQAEPPSAPFHPTKSQIRGRKERSLLP